MQLNQKFNKRSSLRLKGYDYSKAGLYFITICCQNRINRFGVVENGEMNLNEYGQIAHDEWLKLSQRFSNFELDAFQIMPNHMHAILALNEHTVDAGFSPASKTNTNEMSQPNRPQPRRFAATSPQKNAVTTVSDIVGAYKSLVANACLKIFKTNNKTMGKLWQRNYYEHIIRNDKSYKTISEYIINNPKNWEEDKLNIR